MSGERREVRATLDFFHDLDRQLPNDRGPNGEPSTSDFQTFELLEIVEKFAVGFDELPALIQGRDDYRVLIATGVVVRAYAVVGQASPDGAIELISLDLDTDLDWGARTAPGERKNRYTRSPAPLPLPLAHSGAGGRAPTCRSRAGDSSDGVG